MVRCRSCPRASRITPSRSLQAYPLIAEMHVDAKAVFGGAARGAHVAVRPLAFLTSLSFFRCISGAATTSTFIFHLPLAHCISGHARSGARLQRFVPAAACRDLEQPSSDR